MLYGLLLLISFSMLTHTVLSAGFSNFVYWKFAVHGVHNLHPCTGFLFSVNNCEYYGLYTISFYTYPYTVHFQWSFLCAGILQRICRNSDVLCIYSVHILCSTFFIMLRKVYGPQDNSGK